MKDKIKNLKENKKVFIVAIVAIILLIALIIPIRKGLQKVGKFKEKQLKSIASLDLKWEENMNTKLYEDMVLVKDEENIISYGPDSKELWRKKLKEKDEVYMGESAFFISNGEEKTITKFDQTSMDIWSYEMKNPAYTITEIEDYLFVYSKVDDSTRGVTILDKDGKLVLDQEKSKEEILSANISKDKRKFIITSMDTSSPELKSKLTYLKHNGETIWTQDVKDKIIYNILFTGDKKMLLIGDKEIICKDDKGNTLWEKAIKFNLKDIQVIDGDKIHVLYGLEDSYLEVLDTDGKVDYKKIFEKEYNNIEEFDKDAILIGNDGLIGLSEEKISMKKDVKEEIRQIEKTKDEILIVTDKKLEVFKIIDKVDKKDKQNKKDKKS